MIYNKHLSVTFCHPATMSIPGILLLPLTALVFSDSYPTTMMTMMVMIDSSIRFPTFCYLEHIFYRV